MSTPRSKQLFADSMLPGSLHLLAELLSSFAISRRPTPAPKGLRIIAKGCRASARLPWYPRQSPGSKPSATPHTAVTSSVRQKPLHTPAPKGLCIIAKGCRASAMLPWYPRQSPGSKPSATSHPAVTSSVRQKPLHTPALNGLRNTAQGQPSLSEATLGMATQNREANPRLRRTPRSPAASSMHHRRCQCVPPLP